MQRNNILVQQGSLLRAWEIVPLMLWLAMWANLNTGYWDIGSVTGGVEGWLLMIRAVLPFAVLPLSLAVLLASSERLPITPFSPNLLLLLYGCIAVIGTIASPEPAYSLYWSVTFLAAMLCIWAVVKQSFAWLRARVMLQSTWITCLAAALILTYLGRGALFGSSADAYGISRDLDNVSRASGIARWAAVPGLVCLLRVITKANYLAKASYLGIALLCLYIVYRVQSRGAVFGVLGALLFAFAVSGRFRRPAAVVATYLVLGITVYGSLGGFGQAVNAYIRRGQSEQEFRSMTGRTRAYEHGLEAFWDSPIIGQGQWADRLNPKVREHIHNSFLQALLNGGIAGFLAYLSSWIAGWMLFYRLWKVRKVFLDIDQNLMLEAAVVMAFFSLRAIPETTTASFSVDLLVMAAVYCYFDTLQYSVREAQSGQFPIAAKWMPITQ